MKIIKNKLCILLLAITFAVTLIFGAAFIANNSAHALTAPAVQTSLSEEIKPSGDLDVKVKADDELTDADGDATDTDGKSLPWWIKAIIIGGVVLLILIILVIFFSVERRRVRKIKERYLERQNNNFVNDDYDDYDFGLDDYSDDDDDDDCYDDFDDYSDDDDDWDDDDF